MSGPPSRPLGELLAQKRKRSPDPIADQPSAAPSKPRDNPPPPNAKVSVGCWLTPLVFFLLLGASWGYWSKQEAVIVSSWADYDTVMNESLSRNLSKGLWLDFSDGGWATQFTQLNRSGVYNWVFTYNAVGETANHFPAVPHLMALGRLGFSSPEILLVDIAGLLLILALTVLVNQVRIQFGWLACFVAVAGLVLDGAIFTRPFLTGDTLLAATIAWSFAVFTIGIRAVGESKRSILPWPISGALLGAATLFQFQISVWLVLILFGWIGFASYNFVRHKSFGLPVEAFVLFWIGALVVAAPWWIRNCKATGELRPLGYAVQTYLEAANSDKAFANNGNLNLGDFIQKRGTAFILLEQSDDSLVEKEALFARNNVEAASQWSTDNAGKIPKIVTRRLASHFGLTPMLEGGLIPWQTFARVALLLGALLGCWLSWRHWGGAIFLMLTISGLVTAVTWSDHGRYLVPLHALIDVAFAIGVARIVGLVRKQGKS